MHLFLDLPLYHLIIVLKSYPLKIKGDTKRYRDLKEVTWVVVINLCIKIYKFFEVLFYFLKYYFDCHYVTRLLREIFLMETVRLVKVRREVDWDIKCDQRGPRRKNETFRTWPEIGSRYFGLDCTGRSRQSPLFSLNIETRRFARERKDSVRDDNNLTTDVMV